MIFGIEVSAIDNTGRECTVIVLKRQYEELHENILNKAKGVIFYKIDDDGKKQKFYKINAAIPPNGKLATVKISEQTLNYIGNLSVLSAVNENLSHILDQFCLFYHAMLPMLPSEK